ncbi:response regulator [Nitratidesulfovibrio vulgaris]|jgi:CheY-like chemotaxis protein|uniref:Protein Rrf1 n=2 Tax=Nitratidesulfovibrio vulgaris TaxID=881 RepID=RRF1_NITV2|nr:response regulator [Nitratidesulfovibrio vulgaris]P33394.1 RecName: Full=Protein Rrf1 [Nitratidesulfovibrio vulgaris str. Hildenborough]GEB80715.1 protein rrf1 [Desulfovibrio desulfuricans]HBW17090.1 response regulator [Desulfovibrio sp.]AAA72000.1 rrf1 [Nitratidesulfovibrio vulgaris str. Hildenborough]AAS95012.1 response regulator, rrf1 protein [Nitratidesulfovibrio vulgaris str. Hildenborough]ABM29427.1 response regulator receiver protein [Nitratidesulfovibrio vulgaris DP4]
MPARILVVQEDPDIAAYLVSLFRQAGYKADAATEGPDAVEMVQASRPDVVFLDLALPQRWGPRFYSWMVTQPGCGNVPVVLVTDFAGLELMVPNAVGTVDKPFDPVLLLALVDRALATYAKGTPDTPDTTGAPAPDNR